MTVFESLAEYRKALQAAPADHCTRRLDDGRLAGGLWLAETKNAWRAAENGIIPFTQRIKVAKYGRSTKAFLSELEPGSLPCEPNSDLHDLLVRLREALNEGYRNRGSSRNYDVNLTLELFLRGAFGYAVPSCAVLDAIADFSRGRIVEIGAGRGYWASLLTKLGCDVKAVDRAVGPANEYTDIEPLRKLFGDSIDRYADAWFKVAVGTEQILLETDPDRTLLMIWPNTNDGPMASEALILFRGDRVVYVGEPRGMGCAEEAFFEKLWQPPWQLINVLSYPRFPWHFDRVFFYTRAQ